MDGSHMTAGHDPMQHMAAANALANPKDATHVAVQSGSWSDPDTWEGGKVPDAEARVHIPESLEVTYDVSSAVPLDTVRVDGTLKWSLTQNTEMLVETIVTSHGSTIEVGSMADPIPAHIDATITFRDTPINRSADPEQLSHGLVAFGEVDIQGATKESYLTLDNGARAGDTSVEVEGNLSNWKVGDTILFVGTGNGSRDETRVITSVSNDSISFDRPLSHNHQPPAGFDFDTYVGNLSRNVTFRSENPDGTRGHIMMHNGTPDEDDGSINCVRYAAFEDLGRTDASRLTGTDNNPLGRYPLHLHEIGTEEGAPTSMIEGNAVWGSSGWGIVQHSSQAMINHNIVVDTRGAGIVSEDGDETGMWVGNLVTGVQGYDIKSGSHAQVGSEGAAYENQSRVIIQQDNIAANSSIGWNFSGREDFVFGAAVDGAHRKMFERGQVPYDPSPFDVALDHEEPPITDFNDNVVIASGTGVRVFHRQYSDDTDTMSVFRNFDVWGGSSAVMLNNYASNYQFMDSTWQGSGTGFLIDRKTSSAVFNNVDMHDFEVGYHSRGANHEVMLIDTTFERVGEDFRIDDVMKNVTSASLRQELIDYFRTEHGIDYENPMPEIVSSASLQPVSAVTFSANPDADLSIGPNSGSLNITGTITDSVGTRRFNEYVIAKPPNGKGTSKDFDGIKVNFGATLGSNYNNIPKEFSVEDFLDLHGAYRKSDGSWVSPVVNWITDRLTGDQHPVIIEIKLEGFSSAKLAQWELDSYPDPGVNNPGWYDRNGLNTDGSDDGSTGDGSADDDSTDDDSTDDGSTGDSSTDDGSTGDGSTDDGSTDDGSTDDGSTDDGSTGDGSADDESTDDGSSDDGSSDSGSGTTDGQLVGTNRNDTLRDGANSTEILGLEGRDTINGAGGNDIIDGGHGRDRMTGGAGTDIFRFGVDALDGYRDEITDFSVTDGDILDLSLLSDALGLTESEMNAAVAVKDINPGLRVTFAHDGNTHALVVLEGIESGEFSVRDSLILTKSDGGSGADDDSGAILGGKGDDDIEGRPGDDFINGRAGDDNVTGGDGNDTLYGGPGNDTLLGRAGIDAIYGNTGNDAIDGGSSRDFLRGRGGDDTILGASGNDDIEGGPGDDLLVGGFGNDHMSGGIGADIFVFDAVASGNDRVEDFDAGDIVRFDAALGFVETDFVVTASGRNAVVTGAGTSIKFVDIDPNDLVLNLNSSGDLEITL